MKLIKFRDFDGKTVRYVNPESIALISTLENSAVLITLQGGLNISVLETEDDVMSKIVGNTSVPRLSPAGFGFERL